MEEITYSTIFFVLFLQLTANELLLLAVDNRTLKLNIAPLPLMSPFHFFRVPPPPLCYPFRVKSHKRISAFTQEGLKEAESFELSFKVFK